MSFSDRALTASTLGVAYGVANPQEKGLEYFMVAGVDLEETDATGQKKKATEELFIHHPKADKDTHQVCVKMHLWFPL